MNKEFSNKKIILASQSPRRRSLISKLCVDYNIVSPSYEEKLDTDDYTDEKIYSLSLKKALSVLDYPEKSGTDKKSLSESLVVSADTVVVLENKILGKPKDEAQASRMLHDLSGKTHFVVTSVTVVDAETRRVFNETVKTYVTFQDLSDELIENYVRTNKPLDKAGAYGIQEMGSDFIKEVDGDLENVIGLPTKVLEKLLLQAGYSFNI